MRQADSQVNTFNVIYSLTLEAKLPLKSNHDYRKSFPSRYGMMQEQVSEENSTRDVHA